MIAAPPSRLNSKVDGICQVSVNPNNNPPQEANIVVVKMTTAGGISALILRVTRSRRATKVADANADSVNKVKLLPPGCAIIKTPANPMKTAIQRGQSTSSIRSTAHKIVMIIGVACMIVVKSPIGS